jgi:chromosome segregation ATPase
LPVLSGSPGVSPIGPEDALDRNRTQQLEGSIQQAFDEWNACKRDKDDLESKVVDYEAALALLRQELEKKTEEFETVERRILRLLAERTRGRSSDEN